MLGRDVALMHACGSVLMPWQDTVHPKRRSIQTFVVVCEEGRWLIRAFHNSRIRPVALPRGVVGRLILAAFRLRTRLSGREPAGAAQ